MIGFPSVGKSTLLSEITETEVNILLKLSLKSQHMNLLP